MLTIAACVVCIVFWPITLVVLAIICWPITLALLVIGAISVLFGKVFA